MSDSDLLLDNATVITLDRASHVAEAIQVRNGVIVAVGESAALAHNVPPATRRIDLGGKTVVPGFCDAHPHMDREGLRARGGIPIGGLRSIADIAAVVARAVRSVPPDEWIILMPLGNPPHDYFSRPDQITEGRFPNRYDLDAVAPNNPVYIRSVWGYWSVRPFPSVANSMALKRVGITRTTTPPHNVEILHDTQGEPTGVFLERNYAPILEYTLFRELPRFTQDDRVESARLGVKAYNAVGTTAAYEGHGLSPALIRAYREIHHRGELTIRTHTPLSVPSAVFADGALVDLFYHYAGVASDHGVGDDMFRFEGINLGGRADPDLAAIVASGYPYEQWAGHFYQAMDPARFVHLGIEAARLGLRVNCLASRDLDYTLSGYEAIDREVPIKDRRWVVIHVNEATPEQLRRMRRLGVIATAIPGFIYLAGDRYGIDQLRERGVPLRNLLDSGVPIALGTDGVPISMLWTMWEALKRWHAASGTSLGDSRLSREEALRMSVQTGHRLTWSEDQRGSLEVGKQADLVVLDENPLTCPLDNIKDLTVELTMVAGKVVYQKSEPGTQ